jgi:hypothetical protein
MFEEAGDAKALQHPSGPKGRIGQERKVSPKPQVRQPPNWAANIPVRFASLHRI